MPTTWGNFQIGFVVATPGEVTIPQTHRKYFFHNILLFSFIILTIDFINHNLTTVMKPHIKALGHTREIFKLDLSSVQVRTQSSEGNFTIFKFRSYLIILQGDFFWLVPPRKVLSMELVPPNSEKILSSSKIAISPLKKWKFKSEPVRPLILLLSYSKKWRSHRLWHGLSLF